MHRIKRALDYWFHPFDPERFTLVMTILVKNEIDIIETNIRLHAALGVDAFVVMDHMSDDGTRERLESLAKEFEITIIHQPDPVYKQREWMTQLAHTAYVKYGADWIISNDADEFWIPDEGDSLRSLLAFRGSVLTCTRKNMLPPRDASGSILPFYASEYCVENPVNYGDFAKSHTNVNMLLQKIAPKIIVNPRGLIAIKGGNHKAKHLYDYSFLKPYEKIKRLKGITVYHYPDRTYAQFLESVLHRREMLEKHPGTRMGNHYRYWIRAYEEGNLEEIFSAFLFTPEERTFLERIGILSKTKRPGSVIRKALGLDRTPAL